MRKTGAKSMLQVGLAALLTLPAAGVPAFAAPVAPAAPPTGVETAVQEARWRGQRGYHRHGRWNRHRGHGWNPGAAIALGIVGSLIARGVSRGAAYDAIERCDARFRSFERDTGLYTTYGGEKRLCPYLR
ncbi:MAG: BA14K family protein [Hyphomicrobiaceae bacterium]|nr:BA14K family protein [Hyphomicrobiaceae bacterium]